MLYGASFGCWRAPGQALAAAVKMPLLIFATLGTVGFISAMLGALLHPALTRWHIGYGLLAGFAVTCALLGAFAPVFAYFALQAPPPDAPGAMAAYRAILLGNVAAVALAGVAGFSRLLRLLQRLTGSRADAWRIFLAWSALAGLAGSQWSWLISPFLIRPGDPVTLLNPRAFDCNFFEWTWKALCGSL